MIPVMCKIKHNPPETHGDCLRACVETIFGNDPVVPHFAENGRAPQDTTQLLNAFLKPKNMQLVILKSPSQTLNMTLLWAESIVPDKPYLLFGRDHVVVCKGCEIIHDPAWIKSPMPDVGLVVAFFGELS